MTTEYVIWIKDREFGSFVEEFEAEEFLHKLQDDGYKNVEMEEVEVDGDTPEQMNSWLLSIGC